MSQSANLPAPPSYTKPELRALATEFFETRSDEAKQKLQALPNDDWAWIAAQDDFKTFIIASQAKAALGIGPTMTKSMQRAQDWFIKASTRPKNEKKPRNVPQGVEVVDASE